METKKMYRFIGSALEAKGYDNPKPEAGRVYLPTDKIGGNTVAQWVEIQKGWEEDDEWQEVTVQLDTVTNAPYSEVYVNEDRLTWTSTDSEAKSWFLAKWEEYQRKNGIADIHNALSEDKPEAKESAIKVTPQKRWEHIDFEAVSNNGQKTTLFFEYDHKTKKYNMSTEKQEGISFLNDTLAITQLKVACINEALKYLEKLKEIKYEV